MEISELPCGNNNSHFMDNIKATEEKKFDAVRDMDMKNLKDRLQ